MGLIIITSQGCASGDKLKKKKNKNPLTMVPVGCMGHFFRETDFVASHWPRLLVFLLEGVLEKCHGRFSRLIPIIIKWL